ncbi:unnamed protein product [Cuscuta epithymum]|uniref:Uncharacterized protein n=1 Tax=Cuscuta epithymum TaxID=186058 RepID=A0AAV0F057_9ASTE|nr:unnamed protein product [Cuscuta epithymum]
MRERGKSVEINAASSCRNNISEFDFYASPEIACKIHPSASSIGICPHCLKDRLLNLVCSDCGEHRLSSCSCSDISAPRISFLMENEIGLDQWKAPAKGKRDKTEEVSVLRRSSSNCAEIKKSSNGFRKIKRLFGNMKRREKSCSDNDHQAFDEMRVSRSRSVCSLRDDGWSDQYRFSSAKISDVTGGFLFDSEEARKSGFRGDRPENTGSFPYPRSVFPAKESDSFTSSMADESAASFIDIKLDLSSSLRRLGNLSSDRDSSSAGNRMAFGSCRFTGRGNSSDEGVKRSWKRSSFWEWISWQRSSGRKINGK